MLTLDQGSDRGAELHERRVERMDEGGLWVQRVEKDEARSAVVWVSILRLAIDIRIAIAQ